MSAAEEILSRLTPEGSGGKTVRDLRMETGFTQEHIRDCLKRLERENKVAHGPLESYGFDTLRGGRSPDVWFLKTGLLLASSEPSQGSTFACNHQRKPQNWRSPRE